MSGMPISSFFKVIWRRRDLVHIRYLWSRFSINEKLELLGINLIMTFEPENVKAILATQFGDFAKGEIFHKSWHQVFPPNLVV